MSEQQPIQHESYTTYKLDHLKELLVEQLIAQRAIRSSPIEAAFRAVPRHLFVPHVAPEEAYSDGVIPIKYLDNHAVSSSSQPTMMAIMLEQLDLRPGQTVLEIGAGSGYNAALMAHIVGKSGQVVTIDLDEDLVASAREHLDWAGFEQVQTVCADGALGHIEAAPYDRIILTVSADDIVPAWWEQLKLGGRLVLPLGLSRDGSEQRAITFVHRKGIESSYLESISIQNCRFMTLRGSFANVGLQWREIGPDSGLFFGWSETQPIDGDLLYQLLTSSGTEGTRSQFQEWNTGVELTRYEQIDGMGLWAILHEGELTLASLAARGVDMIKRQIVPPFHSGGKGEESWVSTNIVCSKTGVAALMRVPSLPPSLSEQDGESYSSGPFTLYVRQFGPDPSPAQRLVALAQAWDRAGRPSTRGLRVRAYRKDTHSPSLESVETTDVHVIEKKWVCLMLDWP